MISPKFTPPKIEMPSQRAGDPRIGHTLGTNAGSTDGERVQIIGFPFDEGVKLNGGRPGAFEAPPVVRKYFYKFTPDAQNAEAYSKLISQSLDCGDLVCKGEIAAAQAELGKQVATVLKSGAIPVILGGGHETTFGHFLGYVEQKKPVHLVNFDAHPDVRERIEGKSHSGSSFRDALEHSSGLAKGYSVFGLQPHACASSHLEYLRKNNHSVVWAKEVDSKKISNFFSSLSEHALVSIDIDAIDQAFAPGVSAPINGGMQPNTLLDFAFEAGRCKNVCSLDIVEVNPKFDRDDQTSRLAALTLWHFLRGVAAR
jgi:formiminoglutamase